MRIRTIILTVLMTAIAAACTPEQIALFKSLPADQQQAVIDYLYPPAGCVEAMKRVWPQSEWAWGERIMWRESNHQPTAYNRSGASGCWQMMLPLHNRRFTAVGCSPSQWSDPLCNNRAAYHLFREAGRTPWNL
jgi:hypothetical protein